MRPDSNQVYSYLLYMELCDTVLCVLRPKHFSLFAQGGSLGVAPPKTNQASVPVTSSTLVPIEPVHV